MIETIYRIILIFTTIVGLINLKFLNTSVKKILVLILTTLFVELVSAYLDFSKNQTYINYLYFAFALIENIIISNVFISEINNYKKLFTVFSIVIIITLFLFLYYTPLNLLMTKVIFIQGLWVILLTLFYFYNLLKKDDYFPLISLPIFWIAVGYFVYFTSTILLHNSIDYLYKINERLADRTFILINGIANIIMYCLITFSFICHHLNNRRGYL